jgi:undecaprenyl-diphosphatase
LAELRLRHAVILGLVQGPTEVLPVSSSAHLALIPRLGGWPETLDAEARNALEVALHGAAAAALLAYAGMRAKRASPEAAVLRDELARGARELDGRTLVAATLALAPPALAGYLLERRLDRRPGTPRTLAAGLTLGGAALAWADARPGTRALADAGPRDSFALGVAQALALLPGVSRNGATLTAARARGFTREAADALSWRVGLPVLAGAATLKTVRLARSRRGVPPDTAPALAAGAAAALLSTLACAPLLRPGARERPLWPFALYRVGLALVAVASSDSA